MTDLYRCNDFLADGSTVPFSNFCKGTISAGCRLVLEDVNIAIARHGSSPQRTYYLEEKTWQQIVVNGAVVGVHRVLWGPRVRESNLGREILWRRTSKLMPGEHTGFNQDRTSREYSFLAEEAQRQRPRGKRERRHPSWNGSAWLEGSSFGG